MRALAAVAVVLAVLAVALFAARASRAQEAEDAEQRAQLVAAIDVGPLQKELAALRRELQGIREAVTAADGLRRDVAQATAAVQAMDERLSELGETFEKYAETTQPVIEALQPEQQWEYKILRSRSESVANTWGRKGWFLVTAGPDWLYFRRPIRTAEEK
ncbi:MAG: hypothetical protein ACLF0G_17215 [Candidatus Brocadiia bacterium]